MRLLLCFLLSLQLALAFGQDRIGKKMLWYGKAKPTPNLFIHFDKNVYSNNETVWFTAYLVKEGSIKRNLHQILAISLIRNVDTAVIVTKKFIMNKGISTGNFEMPDSIQTGNYKLLAYTDQLVNGVPEAIFVQQVTLKTSIDPSFKASMKLMDEIKPTDQSYKVLVSTTTTDNRFLSKPLNISYRYGKTVKKSKTDQSGQLLMSLPIQIENSDPHLYVKLSSQKDSAFMQMALPRLKQKARVNFYPEGGYIVQGIATNVGFEVKDQQKMPIGCKALLYMDEKIVDTLETDAYGFGKFKLYYDRNSNYALKLVHDGIVDSIYQLPKPLAQGIALHIPKGVVTDTLRLQVRSTGNRQIHIRVHNFTKTFILEPYTMGQNYQSFKIPLSDVPKGLVAVTISDSLDRPLAERLFFAHYNHENPITLSSNRQVYGQREKVNLSINLRDSLAQGLVSIAVVQNNRLELKKMTDIESYSYLNNIIADLPVHQQGLPFKDWKYIENLLLIKGWRRYSWQGLNHLNLTDTLKRPDSLTFTAQVLKNKKVLAKPITVAVMGDSNFRIGSTTATGFLNLNEEVYTSNGRGKLNLFISNNADRSYSVLTKDDFIQMTEKLKKSTLEDEIILPSTLTNNSELVLKGNEKSIRLKEVVIKSRNDYSFMHSKPGSNACGDYVCRYNNFNCPNHPYEVDNKQPIKGHKYNGLNVPYAGCVSENENSGIFSFNFIRYAKEFYENDYKDPQEPAFFSTLYWNYGILLNKKTSNLSFYTSDIVGKFRVVVQGILNQDVVYAEHYFEVKGKQ